MFAAASIEAESYIGITVIFESVIVQSHAISERGYHR
jgi:hypothetical protein